MRFFVDTSAWYALHDRSDACHRDAAGLVEQWRTTPVRLFTSDYVVDETATLLRLRVGHDRAVAFLDYLRTGRSVSLEMTSGRAFDEAENLFRSRDDKPWSFTDCVSFVQMDRLGLVDAFTFDRHFSQYGKTCHPHR